MPSPTSNSLFEDIYAQIPADYDLVLRNLFSSLNPATLIHVESLMFDLQILPSSSPTRTTLEYHLIPSDKSVATFASFRKGFAYAAYHTLADISPSDVDESHALQAGVQRLRHSLSKALDRAEQLTPKFNRRRSMLLSPSLSSQFFTPIQDPRLLNEESSSKVVPRKPNLDFGDALPASSDLWFTPMPHARPLQARTSSTNEQATDDTPESRLMVGNSTINHSPLIDHCDSSGVTPEATLLKRIVADQDFEIGDEMNRVERLFQDDDSDTSSIEDAVCDLPDPSLEGEGNEDVNRNKELLITEIEDGDIKRVESNAGQNQNLAKAPETVALIQNKERTDEDRETSPTTIQLEFNEKMFQRMSFDSAEAFEHAKDNMFITETIGVLDGADALAGNEECEDAKTSQDALVDDDDPRLETALVTGTDADQSKMQGRKNDVATEESSWSSTSVDVFVHSATDVSVTETISVFDSPKPRLADGKSGDAEIAQGVLVDDDDLKLKKKPVTATNADQSKTQGGTNNVAAEASSRSSASVDVFVHAIEDLSVSEPIDGSDSAKSLAADEKSGDAEKSQGMLVNDNDPMLKTAQVIAINADQHKTQGRTNLVVAKESSVSSAVQSKTRKMNDVVDEELSLSSVDQSITQETAIGVVANESSLSPDDEPVPRENMNEAIAEESSIRSEIEPKTQENTIDVVVGEAAMSFGDEPRTQENKNDVVAEESSKSFGDEPETQENTNGGVAEESSMSSIPIDAPVHTEDDMSASETIGAPKPANNLLPNGSCADAKVVQALLVDDDNSGLETGVMVATNVDQHLTQVRANDVIAQESPAGFASVEVSVHAENNFFVTETSGALDCADVVPAEDQFADEETTHAVVDDDESWLEAVLAMNADISKREKNIDGVVTEQSYTELRLPGVLVADEEFLDNDAVMNATKSARNSDNGQFNFTETEHNLPRECARLNKVICGNSADEILDIQENRLETIGKEWNASKHEVETKTPAAELLRAENHTSGHGLQTSDLASVPSSDKSTLSAEAAADHGCKSAECSQETDQKLWAEEKHGEDVTQNHSILKAQNASVRQADSNSVIESLSFVTPAESETNTAGVTGGDQTPKLMENEFPCNANLMTAQKLRGESLHAWNEHAINEGRGEEKGLSLQSPSSFQNAQSSREALGQKKDEHVSNSADVVVEKQPASPTLNVTVTNDKQGIEAFHQVSHSYCNETLENTGGVANRAVASAFRRFEGDPNGKVSDIVSSDVRSQQSAMSCKNESRVLGAVENAAIEETSYSWKQKFDAAEFGVSPARSVTTESLAVPTPPNKYFIASQSIQGLENSIPKEGSESSLQTSQKSSDNSQAGKIETEVDWVDDDSTYSSPQSWQGICEEDGRRLLDHAPGHMREGNTCSDYGTVSANRRPSHAPPVYGRKERQHGSESLKGITLSAGWEVDEALDTQEALEIAASCDNDDLVRKQRSPERGNISPRSAGYEVTLFAGKENCALNSTPLAPTPPTVAWHEQASTSILKTPESNSRGLSLKESPGSDFQSPILERSETNLQNSSRKLSFCGSFDSNKGEDDATTLSETKSDSLAVAVERYMKDSTHATDVTGRVSLGSESEDSELTPENFGQVRKFRPTSNVLIGNTLVGRGSENISASFVSGKGISEVVKNEEIRNEDVVKALRECTDECRKLRNELHTKRRGCVWWVSWGLGLLLMGASVWVKERQRTWFVDVML